MSNLFLNPWIFSGLLALAVPLIFHLIRQQDEDDHAFPSLMFIKRLRIRDRRRRTLRDKWLLLARLLALAFLVIAFCRPLWSPSTDDTELLESARQSVFLVDVSASMSIASQADAAQKVLNDAINNLQSGELAAIVAFDDNASLVHEMSADHESLRQAGANLYRGSLSGVTRFANAFRFANEILADDIARPSRIVVISDLQESGFDQASVQALENVALEILAVQQPAEANLVISDVQRIDDEIQIKVINNGAEPTDTTSIELSLDNVVTELPVESLDAGQGTTLTTPFSFSSSKPVSAQLTIADTTPDKDNGIASDSRRAAVFRLGRTINVLIVTDIEYRRNSVQDERSYFAHSLALADNTRLVEVEDRALDGEDFETMDVIIFDDGVLPSGDVASDLATVIDQGVGVLFVSNTQNLDRDGSPDRLTDYLPGTLAREKDDDESATTKASSQANRIAGFLDFHPLAGQFGKSLIGAGALSDVKFLDYQKLQPGSDDRVLASLDNGDALLMEKLTNKGRVLSLSASLEANISNLATAPGFIRLSHRVIDYLADREPVVETYQRGDVIDLARHAGAFSSGGLWRTALAESGAVIETPSGRQLKITPGKAFYRPAEIGIHQARLSSANADTIAIAVNQDPVESELKRLSNDEFKKRVLSRSWPQQKQDVIAVERQSEPGGLWRWLLIIAALLFIVETVMANRLTTQRNAS